MLTVDYHLENLEIRRLNLATAEEHRLKVQTTAANVRRVLAQARREASRQGGRVVWIMESTTGWARVKELLGVQAEFILANVLQMPRAPKAHRRKTDQIDTARIQREYCNGSLPRAYQPSPWLRRVRRLVDCHQDLTRRRTALQNWIRHYLAHETWHTRGNLQSVRGLTWLKGLALPGTDRVVMSLKVAEFEQVDQLLSQVMSELMEIYVQWPEAQWVDAVRGIGPLTAVAMLAYIGPVGRFSSAEQLISYAGLAPGVSRSDRQGHNLRIGGGGTHSRLRYFVLNATRWLREIPRYQASYERVLAKRGKKVARVVVGRMFLRSLYKMLRSGQPFAATAA